MSCYFKNKKDGLAGYTPLIDTITITMHIPFNLKGMNEILGLGLLHNWLLVTDSLSETLLFGLGFYARFHICLLQLGSSF